MMQQAVTTTSRDLSLKLSHGVSHFDQACAVKYILEIDVNHQDLRGVR